MTPQPTITSLLLLVAMVCTTHAVTLEGKVINVADGYSTTLLDADKIQRRIRSDGIDAREGATVSAQPTVRVSPRRDRRWLHL